MLLGAIAAGEFGALIGLAASLFTLSAGIAGWKGWIALGASALGVAGAALAIRKPRVAAGLMLLAAIGGFVGISLFFVVAGVLFLTGGVLAYVGGSQDTTH
ncbi:MAG TPA: hypothetical protein VFL29_11780 [Candidatus Dormibacteraeota bacterium]|nr:hypothetical protein [Candidatus Dormibacteraeota bacterium]